ncbi:MAG TPA: AMIN domain-containing protein [Candidatus Sulfotelmatobacter sp.]|nr:AMIN domain-containing protein [Candidatus Sulfotelmatobacter sp.]
MKMAMKLTTRILATALLAGAAWAQSPNPAGSGATTAPAAKPLPGAPAPAVKPAIIPVSKPVSTPVAKPAAKPAPAAESDSASGDTSELKSVKVSQSGDDIQIEINANGSVTPRVSKLDSPARVLVELPETAMATATNHISVGKAGVKGVRIGMNGKTPPTTSVVVDLEKAIAYEMTPGPSGKMVLTLHAEPVAKNTPAAAPVKAAAPAAAAKVQTVAAKPQAAAPVALATKTAPAPQAAVMKTTAPAAKTVAVVTPAAAPAKAAPVVTPVAAGAKDAKASAPVAQTKPVVEALKGSEPPKAEDKKWAMTGKRDPFFSPVVQSGGSGCSTGKKCLEIGQINLRGVVKSENGFIAVVTNTLNKAYFLRENDPVFNGYVVKITGDSVVFQETVQDKLGKTFTREVVKKIFTPAV